MRGKAIQDASSGVEHVVAVTVDGRAWVWGRNSKYQCGLGHDRPVAVPQLLPQLLRHRVVAVACGGAHTIALTHEGTAFGWGANAFGQLGVGDTQYRVLPAPVSSPSAAAVSPVLKAGGSGDGPVQHTQDGAAHMYSGVCAGLGHSFLLDSEGVLYGFGWNAAGQLGLGNSESVAGTPSTALGEGVPSHVVYPTVVPIASLVAEGGAVVHVSAGAAHSAIVLANGACITAGSNTCGQLGREEAESSNQFKEVAALTDSDVHCAYGTCGEEFTAIISQAGCVYVFGLLVGVVGADGGIAQTHRPTAVLGLDGKVVTMMACNRGQIVAVDDDGDVWTWGSDAMQATARTVPASPLRMAQQLRQQAALTTPRGWSRPGVGGLQPRAMPMEGFRKRQVLSLHCGRNFFIAATSVLHPPHCICFVETSSLDQPYQRGAGYVQALREVLAGLLQETPAVLPAIWEAAEQSTMEPWISAHASRFRPTRSKVLHPLLTGRATVHPLARYIVVEAGSRLCLRLVAVGSRFETISSGGTVVLASLTDLESNAILSERLEDNLDGTYELKLRMCQAGRFILSMVCGDTALSEAVALVHVVAGASSPSNAAWLSLADWQPTTTPSRSDTNENKLALEAQPVGDTAKLQTFQWNQQTEAVFPFVSDDTDATEAPPSASEATVSMPPVSNKIVVRSGDPFGFLLQPRDEYHNSCLRSWYQFWAACHQALLSLDSSAVPIHRVGELHPGLATHLRIRRTATATLPAPTAESMNEQSLLPAGLGEEFVATLSDPAGTASLSADGHVQPATRRLLALLSTQASKEQQHGESTMASSGLDDVVQWGMDMLRSAAPAPRSSIRGPTEASSASSAPSISIGDLALQVSGSFQRPGRHVVEFRSEGQLLHPGLRVTVTAGPVVPRFCFCYSIPQQQQQHQQQSQGSTAVEAAASLGVEAQSAAPIRTGEVLRGPQMPEAGDTFVCLLKCVDQAGNAASVRKSDVRVSVEKSVSGPESADSSSGGEGAVTASGQDHSSTVILSEVLEQNGQLDAEVHAVKLRVVLIEHGHYRLRVCLGSAPVGNSPIHLQVQPAAFSAVFSSIEPVCIGDRDMSLASAVPAGASPPRVLDVVRHNHTQQLEAAVTSADADAWLCARVTVRDEWGNTMPVSAGRLSVRAQLTMTGASGSGGKAAADLIATPIGQCENWMDRGAAICINLASQNTSDNGALVAVPVSVPQSAGRKGVAADGLVLSHATRAIELQGVWRDDRGNVEEFCVPLTVAVRVDASLAPAEPAAAPADTAVVPTPRTEEAEDNVAEKQAALVAAEVQLAEAEDRSAADRAGSSNGRDAADEAAKVETRRAEFAARSKARRVAAQLRYSQLEQERRANIEAAAARLKQRQQARPHARRTGGGFSVVIGPLSVEGEDSAAVGASTAASNGAAHRGNATGTDIRNQFDDDF